MEKGSGGKKKTAIGGLPARLFHENNKQIGIRNRDRVSAKPRKKEGKGSGPKKEKEQIRGKRRGGRERKKEDGWAR